MTGKQPKHEIIHIDHDIKNNAFSNLSDVPRAIKGKNQRLRKDNTSGIVGVLRVRGRWVAQAKTGDKSRHILMTDDFFEACCARKSIDAKYGFHENHGLKH